MRFPEYDTYDGLGLADLVRRKELSASELVEAAIERIERRNPGLNAVIHTMAGAQGKKILLCSFGTGGVITAGLWQN